MKSQPLSWTYREKVLQQIGDLQTGEIFRGRGRKYSGSRCATFAAYRQKAAHLADIRRRIIHPSLRPLRNDSLPGAAAMCLTSSLSTTIVPPRGGHGIPPGQHRLASKRLLSGQVACSQIVLGQRLTPAAPDKNCGTDERGIPPTWSRLLTLFGPAELNSTTNTHTQCPLMRRHTRARVFDAGHRGKVSRPSVSCHVCINVCMRVGKQWGSTFCSRRRGAVLYVLFLRCSCHQVCMHVVPRCMFACICRMSLHGCVAATPPGLARLRSWRRGCLIRRRSPGKANVDAATATSDRRC